MEAPILIHGARPPARDLIPEIIEKAATNAHMSK